MPPRGTRRSESRRLVLDGMESLADAVAGNKLTQLLTGLAGGGAVGAAATGAHPATVGLLAAAWGVGALLRIGLGVLNAEGVHRAEIRDRFLEDRVKQLGRRLREIAGTTAELKAGGELQGARIADAIDALTELAEQHAFDLDRVRSELALTPEEVAYFQDTIRQHASQTAQAVESVFLRLESVEAQQGEQAKETREAHAGQNRILTALAQRWDREQTKAVFNWLWLPQRTESVVQKPSFLFDAKSGVLPFRGRDDCLESIQAWCDAAGRFDLRIYRGPGGIGKTALLLKACHQLSRQGWLARLCLGGPDSDLDVLMEALSQFQKLFLLVDYANEWDAGQLRGLLSAVLRSRTGHGNAKTRVVFVVREVGHWWHSFVTDTDGPLKQHLSRCGVAGATGPDYLGHSVAPLYAGAPASRGRLFMASCQVLAPLLGGVVPSKVEVDLAAPLFDRVLYLHMAAYAATLGSQLEDEEELLDYVLQREHTFLRRQAAAEGLEAAVSELDDWTEPAGIEMALAAATLARGFTTRREAEDVLGALAYVESLAEAHRIGHFLRQLYPSETAWVGGLGPDLLGEHLIRRLGCQEIDGLVPTLLAATPLSGQTSVLTTLNHVGGIDVEFSRSLRAMALAGPMERLLPSLIVAKTEGGPLLEAIAGFDPKRMADADAELLAGLERELPLPTTVLRRFALAVERTLRDRVARGDDDQAARARVCTNLACRLSECGQRREAVGAAEEAVEIFRELVAVDPDAFRPDFATALGNLAVTLRGRRRHQEALMAAQEAVTIQRELADVKPDTFRPDLATSLTNLTGPLKDCGRAREAVGPNEEAVRICRELSAENRGAFGPRLAVSLHNLALALGASGRHHEALGLTEEAVRIDRELAAENLDAFRPQLAACLASHALTLRELGRQEEAVGPAEEAMSIWRELVAADPDAFRPALATSLQAFGAVLNECGRREEALPPAEEAVSTHRGLATEDPDVFGVGLAGSLTCLARLLDQSGRPEEALDLAEEAASIYRKLAEEEPNTFRPYLATCLDILVAALSNCGRQQEALGPAGEAVSTRRELASEDPEASQLGLADSLSNLATILGRCGQRQEAIRPAEEAVSICRDVASEDPDASPRGLAGSLHTFATVLSECGRRGEALGPAEEAAHIYRELAIEDPEAYRVRLADSLKNLATMLSECGRRPEALSRAEEATHIYRELASEDPDAFRPRLASSLNTLAIELSECGRQREALEPASEAASVWRLLAAQDPNVHRSDLAISLNTLTLRLRERGRLQEALCLAEEVVHIHRELADENADVFRPRLASSLCNYAAVLNECGRRQEAMDPAEQAVSLGRKLAAEDPEAFRPALVTALGTRGTVLRANRQHVEAIDAFTEGLTVLLPLAEELPRAFLPLSSRLANDLISAAKAAQCELGEDRQALLSQLEALGERSKDAGGK